MTPEMNEFWNEVRTHLRSECGQGPGKRERLKVARRKQLAVALRLSDHTLKGFLNGNQLGLGQEALFILLESMPELKNRFVHATGRKVSSPLQKPSYERAAAIELTVQFEGSRVQSQSFSARLPPGKAGVVTVRIVPDVA